MYALEAGDDGDFLTLVETADQFGAVDFQNARRSVDVGGLNRQLPAEPGPRVDIHILQRDGEQAGSDLLAARDNGVVFAGIEDFALRQGFFAPGDQLIRRSGHGGDHDGNFVPGIDLALDVAGNVADALDSGDRGPAEFHDKTSHGRRLRFFRQSRRPHRPGGKARIDNGAIGFLQPDGSWCRFRV